MRRETHVEDGDDEGEEEKVEVRVGEDRLHFIGVLLRQPYKCHVRNPKVRSTSHHFYRHDNSVRGISQESRNEQLFILPVIIFYFSHFSIHPVENSKENVK